MVATAPAPPHTPTMSPSGPQSSPPPSASGIPKPQDDDTRQTFAAMSGRIKNSPYFSQEIRELLEQKLKGQDTNNQDRAGLGGAVDANEMAKMLDKLEGLAKKQPPLTTEHIQAIFLAGFVKGGVQGVLNFVNSPTNAQYLESSGFEKMKTLLETDYKRSIRYVLRYAERGDGRPPGFMTNDIPKILNQIYGESDAFGRWQKKIYEEDTPSRLNRRLTPEELARIAEMGFGAGEDVARANANAQSNPYKKASLCDDYAFWYAEKVKGISRFAFSRVETDPSGNSFRGKSISELPGLLSSARAGTVFHVSNTGFAGENADSRQGSHWAVYLGNGLVGDNHGDRWTLPEFLRAYGNRKLEAFFIHPNQ